MKNFHQFLIEASKSGGKFASLPATIEPVLQSFKVMHWNISGENFLPIHGLLGEVYDGLAGFQDRIAEKSRGDGSSPIITGTSVSLPGAYDVDSCIAQSITLLTSLRASVASVDLSDSTIDNIVGEMTEAIDVYLYKLKSSKE